MRGGSRRDEMHHDTHLNILLVEAVPAQAVESMERLRLLFPLANIQHASTDAGESEWMGKHGGVIIHGHGAMDRFIDASIIGQRAAIGAIEDQVVAIHDRLAKGAKSMVAIRRILIGETGTNGLSGRVKDMEKDALTLKADMKEIKSSLTWIVRLVLGALILAVLQVVLKK